MTSSGGRGDWPVAPRTNETEFFWDGVDRRELRIQVCEACGRLRHPPRPSCPSCGSLDWGYRVMRGTGTIYTFAVHHRPAVPGPSVPYVSAIVELDEGVRMLSNVVGSPFDQLAIGVPVSVTFETVQPGLTLPYFGVCRTPGTPSEFIDE
ncbi:Zn-ribbon domain-containing OB-fold protein [Streptomyces sp. NPDC058321]|uniref:Zn-ribbon domain-containing OB-fold protein n=1 Tax=Streptomyces sp. NPDC058321 TaxID=3346445 RepID=UPI0036EB39CC